jgi:hypothetical protein
MTEGLMVPIWVVDILDTVAFTTDALNFPMWVPSKLAMNFAESSCLLLR